LVDERNPRAWGRPGRRVGANGKPHPSAKKPPSPVSYALVQDAVATHRAITMSTKPDLSRREAALQGMPPGITSVGFRDGSRIQGRGLDWPRNGCIRFAFLARGKVEFRIDGKLCRLERGQLAVTRPWQTYRPGNSGSRSCRLYFLTLDLGALWPHQSWQWPPWLILSPADLQQLTLLLRQNEQPVWQANREIGRCFEQIGELLDANKPANAETRIRLGVNKLLIALLSLLQEQPVRLDPRLTDTRRSVAMFLTALPEHLEDGWTLEETVRQSGLSPSTFAKYCRQLTGLTPAGHLAQCRNGESRRLRPAQAQVAGGTPGLRGGAVFHMNSISAGLGP